VGELYLHASPRLLRSTIRQLYPKEEAAPMATFVIKDFVGKWLLGLEFDRNQME